MGFLREVENENLLNILKTAKYNPLVYLSNIYRRATTPMANQAWLESSDFLIASTNILDSDKIMSPIMVIEKTDVLYIDTAFEDPLLTGIVYNLKEIEDRLKIFIDTVMSENPEGDLYIWVPKNDRNLDNYTQFVSMLSFLASGLNGDIVMLTEYI